ncbi:aldose 1-epimerase [Agrobacterium rubi]|uniref:aldose epimerase family protein n=1 Tax=Agrobacterium rubi TaxID=28099 RepID=UPI0015736CF2|nr:aldose 1-epimerase [Agrobacterium rubi]MCL6654968.1 galactose mutarotase [Agrobacterium rubi]NTF09720.1 aldose 1-epimerase [Agrobacterium rubi]NTF22627.1 aldose 1-epimerase [Agrobacterium rubi]NTF29484.1 aldose 1-epimerase [Agrobacterium rubi]
MPSPDVISIASGPFSARICPEWGGRMTHLAHADVGDLLVPTTAEVFEPWDWPKAGAYPLFPYHNRLYRASFDHAGVEYHVVPHPALGPDAMHGPAHRRPWRVSSHKADQATLFLEYAAGAEWPFAFEAQQSFSLSGQGLSVELTITNRAAVPAPAGIGWHPYFAVGLDHDVWTDASLAYPLDARDVPTGSPPCARAASMLPAVAGYTQHLANWSKARMHVDRGFHLVLEADPVFHHLAAHRTENYACLEPVSMAAGALHQPEQHRADWGLTILSPGDSLTGTIRLHIHNSSD